MSCERLTNSNWGEHCARMWEKPTLWGVNQLFPCMCVFGTDTVSVDMCASHTCVYVWGVFLLHELAVLHHSEGNWNGFWRGKITRVLSDKAMKKKGGGRAEREGPQGSGGESEGPRDVNPIFQKWIHAMISLKAICEGNNTCVLLD